MSWKSSFRQNYRTTFSPTVPTSAAEISHVVADVEAHSGVKWKHLKSGGKQWQATPKNLLSTQRTRAIPVAWLSSGFCPNRPKGWIPIIIISPTIVLWRWFITVFLYRLAAARYRAQASIIPGSERPEETTIYYKISLVQMITNLNVILYLSKCHTVYVSVLILFMIMP